MTLGAGFEPARSTAPSALEADALVRSATPAQNLINQCFINISMELQIDFYQDTKNVELPENSTVETLISHLHLLPDSVIVISEDKVLPVDAPLRNKQRIRVLRVASGG